MYRDFISANPTPAVRLAFNARAIIDHGTALEGANRTRRTEVFVMCDGGMVKADGRIVTEVAREAVATERAQRAYIAAGRGACGGEDCNDKVCDCGR